jgi:hypothetical protein
MQCAFFDRSEETTSAASLQLLTIFRGWLRGLCP